MKVVIAHDYLTQRGGAERVTLELAHAFPGAPVLTSMYLPDRTFPGFRELEVVSLKLERAAIFRRDPRRALPILGEMFRRQRLQADLVICSSSGFSHLLRSTGPKIVYCHNPPRWLHQPEDYSLGLKAPEKAALRLLRPRLMSLDRKGAAEATHYIANSENVAARIERVYGRRADVIHPPRGLEPEGDVEAVEGLKPGFLLTVGRPRGYKRTDLLIDAVAGMPEQTLVVVGHVSPYAPDNVRQLTAVSDAQLRWLYRSAKALLACSKEDFGLTPVEAFAFGLPVGATPEGGYLETCIDGVTGIWLDTADSSRLRESIRQLAGATWDRDQIVEHGARWAPAVFRSAIRQAVEDLHAGH